jgi:hypothetical protein
MLGVEFSGVFRRTREAYLEHENAKAELKALMPEDAKEATGHGIRAAVTIDVLDIRGLTYRCNRETTRGQLLPDFE